MGSVLILTPVNNPTIVLAGAGHAHLYIASQAQQYRQRGIRLLLIDPDHFWYSGLATGMLSGMYSAADDQIDPRALIEAAGGEFLQDRVVGIDCDTKRLYLESGSELGFDWLSLNLGSRVMSTDIVNPEHLLCWPVKPISNLYRLRETLVSSIEQHGRMPDICVVGGGYTGCEIAANLLGLAEHYRVKPAVTLVSDNNRLLPGAPAGAADALASQLEQRGVRLLLQNRVCGSRPGQLLTDQHLRLPTEQVVLATGLEANPLPRQWDLMSSSQGVAVNACLQSVTSPAIFAAGDCADFQPRPLPKLGVFGVRAAAIVHHNLLASHDNRPLKPYHPQRHWLAILNLGNNQGLALWHRFWWLGRSSLWFKDRIDRRFMDGYRNLYRS